jgi:hypothetical protein
MSAYDTSCEHYKRLGWRALPNKSEQIYSKIDMLLKT